MQHRTSLAAAFHLRRPSGDTQVTEDRDSSNLPQAPLDVLRSIMPFSTRRFCADQNIQLEGDAALQMFGILSGMARCFRVNLSGRRHICRFAGPGTIIGLEVNGVYRYSAEAITDCDALLLRFSAVDAALETSLAGWRALMQAMADELAQKDRAAFRLARLDADHKVADFLLEMSSEGYRREVAFDMSRNDLADHLGITLETVSRSLHKLQRMGFISLRAPRQLSVVSASALRKYMNDEPSEAAAFPGATNRTGPGRL
jgi:CRP-like cAMP-binding protein